LPFPGLSSSCRSRSKPNLRLAVNSASSRAARSTSTRRINRGRSSPDISCTGRPVRTTNTEAVAMVGRVPSRGKLSRIQAQHEISGLSRAADGVNRVPHAGRPDPSDEASKLHTTFLSPRMRQEIDRGSIPSTRGSVHPSLPGGPPGIAATPQPPRYRRRAWRSPP